MSDFPAQLDTCYHPFQIRVVGEIVGFYLRVGKGILGNQLYRAHTKNKNILVACMCMFVRVCYVVLCCVMLCCVVL